MGITVRNLEAAEPVPLSEGCDFLAASIGNSACMMESLGGPVMERRSFTTTQRARGQLHGNNLDDGQQLLNGHYDGCEVEVLVPFEGRLRKILTTTVIGSMTYPILCRRDVVNATTYQIDLDAFSRPSTSYWLGIAAVDGNNDPGPVAWVEYAAGATLPTGDKTHTVVTQIAASTEPGAIDTLAAPTNLVATYNGTDDVVDVTYDPVAGAAGYVGFILYQDPATCDPDEYLTIADQAREIPAGAHVILRKRILSKPSATVSPRVWGGNTWTQFSSQTMSGWKFDEAANPTWVAYGSDPRPGDVDADYFLRHDGNELFNVVTHSGIYDTFYAKVGMGFVFDTGYWMRVPPGHAPITLTVTHGGVTLVSGQTTMEVTDQWQYFSQRWQVTSVSQDANVKLLRIDGNTNVIDIAAMEVVDATVRLGVTTNKHDLPYSSKLRVADDMWLRNHADIKNPPKTADVAGLTSVTGHTARGPTSLYTFFRQCQINGLRPWNQLEWVLFSDELLDVFAYKAAPANSNHPMALKRVAQGQVEAWTDVFPEMIYEIGNEMWISSGEFFGAPLDTVDIVTGQVYSRKEFSAMMHRYIIEVLETSDFWPAIRKSIKFTAGGHIGSDHGAVVANGFHRADLGVIAAYGRNGWEAGAAATAERERDYEGSLNFVIHQTNRWLARLAEMPAGTAIGTYEFASGYIVHSGTDLARVPQEVTNKSRAAMTSQLDAVCARGVLGYTLECYFLLGDGWRWSTHAPDTRGGGTVLDWQMLKLMYEHTGPAIFTPLSVTQSAAEQYNTVELGLEPSTAGTPTSAPAVDVLNGRAGTVAIAVAPDRGTAVVNGDNTINYTPNVDYSGPDQFSYTVTQSDGTLRTEWVRCELHTKYDTIASITRYEGADISAYEVKSVTDPSRRCIVVCNRLLDPSYFRAVASEGLRDVVINTDLASASSLEYFANVGDPREHNTGPVGFRLDMADGDKANWGWAEDPLCVQFPDDWSAGSVPGDLSAVAINDAFGADADGLQGGNCVILKMDGCVD